MKFKALTTQKIVQNVNEKFPLRKECPEFKLILGEVDGEETTENKKCH